MGWLCGTAGKTLETDLLLKQNNKSEQISRIIVGSGKNNILFIFIFLQDCLRDDALPPPTLPGYVKDKKEQKLQRNQGFHVSPITFPHNLRKNVFLPCFSYKETDVPSIILLGTVAWLTAVAVSSDTCIVLSVI